ncbi:unnamed protein product [Dicrocoelium dendriticum]|nr:unnamed protein product [Dicrocoelium dendriticum]
MHLPRFEIIAQHEVKQHNVNKLKFIDEPSSFELFPLTRVNGHSPANETNTFPLEAVNDWVIQQHGTPLLEDTQPKPDGVLMRITKRRRVKHNMALDEWKQSLSLISQAMEADVVACCELAARSLQESWDMRDQTLEACQSVQDQSSSAFTDILSSRDLLESENCKSKEIIDRLESQLFAIEQKRVTAIRQQFNRMSDYLTKHSHLSSAELNKLFLEEIMRVNVELLSNRREIITLAYKLRLTEAAKNRHDQLTWSEGCGRWRKINVDHCIKELKNKLLSDECCFPGTVQTLVNQLTEKHTELRQKEETLIAELCQSMIPPTFTSDVIQQWTEQARTIYLRWEELNEQYLQLICQAYESHSQECIDMVKALQVKLVEKKYADTMEAAGKTIKSQLIPTLGRLQSQFEENLNYLDNYFSWSTIANKQAIVGTIYRFAESLTEFWQECAIKPMDTMHDSMLQRLAAAKSQSAQEAELQDVALNEAIDSLRQGATEAEVEERLKTVDHLLSELKSHYEESRDKQIAIVDEYAAAVPKLLEEYETSCERFFGVHEITARYTEPSKNMERNKAETSGQFEVIRVPQNKRPLSGRGWTQTVAHSSRTPRLKKKEPSTHRYFRTKPRSDALEDISIAAGTTGLHITKKPKANQTYWATLKSKFNFSGVLGDELPTVVAEAPRVTAVSKSARGQMDTAREGTDHQFRVDQFILNAFKPPARAEFAALIHRIKREARKNFLTHMGEWYWTVLDQTNEETVLRREEANAEFDLHIRLNETQAHRAREDIANVRLTEIVQHRTRIKRHEEAAKLLLADLQANAMLELNKLLDTLQSKTIEMIDKDLRPRMGNATKSVQLTALKCKFEDIVKEHMKKVCDSLLEARQRLEDRIKVIRNSNFMLVENLRLFSDGGNFAPEEAEYYKTRIQELGTQISSTEEEIAGKMEAMEKERRTFINARVKAFERELAPNMTDVIYAENVARCATNAAVRIKGNIADSESQRKMIDSYLHQLEEIITRLEYCSDSKSSAIQCELDHVIMVMKNAQGKPNQARDNNTQRTEFDTMTQRQVCEEALGLFEQLCHSATHRCTFLTCLRMETGEREGGLPKQSTETVRKEVGNMKTVMLKKKPDISPPRNQLAKVEEKRRPQHLSQVERPSMSPAADLKTTEQLPLEDFISRPGRNVAEDPCIRVVQTIMAEQARHMGSFGIRNLEQERSDGRGEIPDKSTDLRKYGKGWTPSETLPPAKSNDSRVIPKEMTLEDSKASKNKKTRVRDQKRSRISVTMRTTPKSGKSDGDFGGIEELECDDDEYCLEEVTLIGRTKRICRENLQAMLHLSELYYRQKGARQPTRPSLIPNTFDEAKNTLVNTLRQKYDGVEVLRVSTVKEFARQLTRLEELASRLPPVLFAYITNEMKSRTLDQLLACEEEHGVEIERLTQLRLVHAKLLRPDLGSPSNRDQLMQLEQEENERQSKLGKLLGELYEARQNILDRIGSQCCANLSTNAEMLFLRFDRLVCVDDIEWIVEEESTGKLSDLKATKSPPSNEQKAGTVEKQTEIESAQRTQSDRGKHTWYELKLTETNPEKNEPEKIKSRSMKKTKQAKTVRVQATSSKGEEEVPDSPKDSPLVGCRLITAKTTAAHLAVLASRDRSVKDFMEFMSQLYTLTNKSYQDGVRNNERWKTEWTESVRALQKLF